MALNYISIYISGFQTFIVLYHWDASALSNHYSYLLKSVLTPLCSLHECVNNWLTLSQLHLSFHINVYFLFAVCSDLSTFLWDTTGFLSFHLCLSFMIYPVTDLWFLIYQFLSFVISSLVLPHYSASSVCDNNPSCVSLLFLPCTFTFPCVLCWSDQLHLTSISWMRMGSCGWLIRA